MYHIFFLCNTGKTRTYSLTDLTWTTKINNFNCWSFGIHQKNIFRFQIYSEIKILIEHMVRMIHLPQWRTFSSGWERKSNADNNCKANLRVKFSDTPRKFVLRNKSYKLYDNNSKTRHRWLRNVKCRFNFTRERRERHAREREKQT